MSTRARSLAAIVCSIGVLVGRRAAADCPAVRPTDPGGYQGFAYGADPVASYATPEGRVRVWYATAGAQAPTASDAPQIAGAVVEAAIDGYAAMGFLPAIGDGDYPSCASNGGDDRLDVYLVHFAGADGEAATERCVEDGAASRCSGFLLVDSRLEQAGYASFQQGAETVLPHEYFHLVQDAYDAAMDRWWAEGSAQWATKQIHPELTDLERFLPAYFGDTTRSIDAPPGGAVAGFLYGTAIWPVFLGERHGAAIVREILEAIAASGSTVLDATDGVLATKGTSLAAEFTTFAAWNAATGARAGAGGYSRAATYPMVATQDLPSDAGASVKGISSGLAAFYQLTTGAAPRVVSLDTDSTRNAGVVVPLEGGAARLDRMTPLPARIEGDAVVVVAGQRALKTDAPFSLVVSAPPTTDVPPETQAASGCSFASAPTGRDAAMLLAAAGLSAIARRRKTHHTRFARRGGAPQEGKGYR